jgi:hypothetical protein
MYIRKSKTTSCNEQYEHRILLCTLIIKRKRDPAKLYLLKTLSNIRVAKNFRKNYLTARIVVSTLNNMLNLQKKYEKYSYKTVNYAPSLNHPSIIRRKNEHD